VNKSETAPLDTQTISSLDYSSADPKHQEVISLIQKGDHQ